MSEWPTIELGQLAEFRNGLNYSAADNGTGLAVVGVSDFQDKSFVDFSGLAELDQSALSTPDALIRKNDIIFVRSNGNRELIGRSLLVLADPPKPTSHSGFTIRLRFTDNRADPRFFAYFLRGGTIRRHLSSQGGGTSINNLNQGILSRLTVPLPPLETQRRIASILGAYDDLIEVNRRRIAVLEEMARGLFEEWFVRLRFPGHEAVPTLGTPDGPLPEGWRYAKLAEYVSATYGYTESATKEPVGPKFLRVMDINKSPYIDWDAVPFAPFEGGISKYQLLPGDIVVGRMADVGKIGFIDREISAIAASYLVRIRPTRPDHSMFIYYLMATSAYLNYVTGASTGTTRKSAGIPVLTGYQFRLPTADLIVRFGGATIPLREMGALLVISNARLTAARDLLLPRLISGQLSLKAAERELEDAA